MNIQQEWIPSEDEIPADHWSKSPEYLAEKAQAQKLTPETIDLPNQPKPILPLHKRLSTHQIQMRSCEVAYVLTSEDKERIAREKEREALKTQKSALSSEHEAIFEELAKNMLHKVDEAFGC